MNGSNRNLNLLGIPTDTSVPRPLSDPQCHVPLVSCYFRNIADHLIREIEQAEVVFGCVAWLTHLGVLDALSRTRGVAFAVQKEDFLRPDWEQRPDDPPWIARLRAAYAALPRITRDSFPGVLSSMCAGSAAEEMEAVRAVGSRQGGTVNRPRAHHKFVLFGRFGEEEEPGYPVDIVPYAVWTGSYNFTQNGSNSLENAVVIRDPAIVAAYFEEFQQVMALSEPLDWNSEWVEPEWRIGT